ncbi:hypothetical protein [Halorientalis pallida]|uniref:Uncharacterized protein n=1 Tax=Halorientalis pallida TaxID=2479928 RepID=A0A498L2X6_9EURY|nr:hypothetical protein [Halorientalis pallida]RXK51651.1 hypothetical protein EAF64_03190 [Halorientalis pallida]
MRFKVAPEPVDSDLLAAVNGAIPLVPGSVDDCCARIQNRTGVGVREDAEAWLTFCRALRLATETDRGYERQRREYTDETVADAFAERVFGVAELRDALDAAGEPLSAEAAFDAIRDVVPTWERNRHGDWVAVWTERTRRLLDWGVVFGRVERSDDGYRSV